MMDKAEEHQKHEQERANLRGGPPVQARIEDAKTVNAIAEEPVGVEDTVKEEERTKLRKKARAISDDLLKARNPEPVVAASPQR